MRGESRERGMGLPTEPYQAPRARRHAHAWASPVDPRVWRTGTMCEFMTGATGGVDGERINFGCTDQSYIVGDPVEGTVWTARRVVLEPNTTNVLESEEAEIRTLALIGEQADSGPLDSAAVSWPSANLTASAQRQSQNSRWCGENPSGH